MFDSHSKPRFNALPSFVMVLVLIGAFSSLPASADSHVRIVRLSDVQGSVQVDKNTGTGFENAFLNLPITEGVQVKTRMNGRAEIEFEDGSSMRIAPNTLVQFSSLSLNDSGKRVSVVKLSEGMAYVNWLGKGSDDFTLNFSREKVQLDRAAHFRVETSPEIARFAVFKGDVAIDGPSEKVIIGKKKMAEFDASNNDKYKSARNIEEAPLDSWDKESIAYHDQYARNNSPDTSSPYGYGASDLNYYGAFTNIAGYGTMWQPFFSGIGWDPFMDGAWSWAPGMGYGFVSAYPWGWLPYHYGNWMFIPNYGWMWQPGSNFSMAPHFAGTVPVHFVVPQTPSAGPAKTVIVGKGGPLLTSSPSRLVLRGGSAGMGVARGSLSNLGHLNHQVVKSGFAEVRPTPQFAATSANATPNTTSGSAPAMGNAGRSVGSVPVSHSSSTGGGHRN